MNVASRHTYTKQIYHRDQKEVDFQILLSIVFVFTLLIRVEYIYNYSKKEHTFESRYTYINLKK